METRELIEELGKARDALRGIAGATVTSDLDADVYRVYTHHANMVGEAIRRLEKGAEMIEKARFYDAIRNDEGAP